MQGISDEEIRQIIEEYREQWKEEDEEAVDEKIAAAVESIDIPEQEFFEDTDKYQDIISRIDKLQADLKENEKGDEGQQ